MSVDANEIVGGEEDGGNLICVLEDHDMILEYDVRGEANYFL
jgi:hypothetical protein